jgi:hypothetical protein
MGEFGPRAGREPLVSREAASERVDAETLEVIQAFEAFYAATPPPADASPEEPAHAGEDRIEFPDDFRVPAQRGSHEPAPDSRSADDDLGIDDAFALLRAAEAKGRTLAGRHVIDRDGDGAASGRAVTSERSSTTDERVTASHFEPEAGRDWSAKASAVWPKVLAAGTIALVVGAGLGYVAGYTPMPPSTHAKIEVSPAGGAQLRFDYELDKK